MSLSLVVLGANSAHPRIGSFSSSFVLNHNERLFLIDAGEGCQIKMQQFKVKRSRITDVFISHLHGDHLYGLPGFITSENLWQRTKPMTIWGPQGINKYLDAIFEVSQVYLNFQLTINEINAEDEIIIYDNETITISAFPLEHRIPTNGYLFKEKTLPRNIISEKIKELNLSIDEIKLVKKGGDIERDGQNVLNKDLTFQKAKPKSFAYCSDTLYSERIIPLIENVDLLYHEATYLQDLSAQARERMHSTALEAATIANKCGANQLLIGHFSSRYEDLSGLLNEAKTVFTNTSLAEEGFSIEI